MSQKLLSDSETNWRNIFPALADRYHVIAPDYYGFGNSDHPEIVRMVGYYKNPTYSALKNLTTWFVHDQKSLGGELEAVINERYENVMRPEIRKSYTNHVFPTMLGEGVIPPNALRQMKQPILMLHGVEDRFVAKESSLSLLQYLPNAQLHLI